MQGSERAFLQAQILPLPYDLNFFLSVLLGDSFICLVVRTAESIVGCVTAQVETLKREIRILSLCILPEARQQGGSLYRID